MPPTAANSFARVNNSTGLQVAVLAEYDTAYINTQFESMFDTVDNVDQESVAAAALVLARAVHVLAAGPTTDPNALYPVGSVEVPTGTVRFHPMLSSSIRPGSCRCVS